MEKISKKKIVSLIICLSVAMIFLLSGILAIWAPLTTYREPGSAYARGVSDAVYLYIPIGVTIILLTVIAGIISYFIKKKGLIISRNSKIISITALLFGCALIIYGNGVLNYPPWRMVGWQVAGPFEISIGIITIILLIVIGIYYYIISNKEQG
ncbi:MAG: hypothetical protein ACFFCV_06550 [Promethearchaeota archaeon]